MSSDENMGGITSGLNSVYRPARMDIFSEGGFMRFTIIHTYETMGVFEHSEITSNILQS
jgi:hypothetical protein